VPTPLFSANETKGSAHFSEPKRLLSPATPGPATPLSALLQERVLQQDDTGGDSADRSAVARDSTASRDRMQRIQNLVLELNQEIEASGDDSVQVAVLRGRISEPIGEGAETGARDAWNITRESLATGMMIPPPYEP